jgi:hypothetical protein
MKRDIQILGYRVVEGKPDTFYPQYKKHSWFGFGKPKWYHYIDGYTETAEYFCTKKSALEFIERARAYNEHETRIVYEDVVTARLDKLEALKD